MEKTLIKASTTPGYRIHPFETYAKLRQEFSIEVNHPIDLYKNNINEMLLDQFVDKRIQFYKKRLAAVGLATGTPGGLLGVGLSLPDIEEYIRALYRLAQEISHTYGLIPHPLRKEVPQDISKYVAEVEEEILKALFLGLGGSGVSVAVKEISKKIAEKEAKDILVKRVQDKIITKLIKEIAKILGKQVTKKQISKWVARGIPILGGIVCAAINYKSFEIIGKNMKNNLKKEREKMKEIVLDYLNRE